MKFIPILFSTEMVQAILADRKKQTRRVVKLPNYHPSKTEKQQDKLSIKNMEVFDGNNDSIGFLKNRFGQVGDVLWVRETMILNKNSKTYWPVADGYSRSISALTNKPFESEKVVPSIYMPKEACRLFLKIKSIRVERLQDISTEDIKSEGVTYPGHLVLGKENNALSFWPKGRNLKDNPPTEEENMFAHWAELWCKINGRNSWDENPWVWVIDFERIEKPVNF